MKSLQEYIFSGKKKLCPSCTKPFKCKVYNTRWRSTQAGLICNRFNTIETHNAHLSSPISLSGHVIVCCKICCCNSRAFTKTSWVFHTIFMERFLLILVRYGYLTFLTSATAITKRSSLLNHTTHISLGPFFSLYMCLVVAIYVVAIQELSPRQAWCFIQYLWSVCCSFW